MRRILSIAVVPTLLAAVLSACARDDAAALDAHLSKWFTLEKMRFFKSKMRCTTAVFTLESPMPRPALSVQNDVDVARRQFRMGRLGAIRIDGYSPNDLTDALLLSNDGAFGKEALASVAQGKPCFVDTAAEQVLRRAFTRKGATLVYDRDSEGVIVLDPAAMVIVYVAGDLW
jgi:hypothetical protein